MINLKIKFKQALRCIIRNLQIKLKKYDLSPYSNWTDCHFYCAYLVSYAHQKRYKKVQIHLVSMTIFHCYLGVIYYFLLK